MPSISTFNFILHQHFSYLICCTKQFPHFKQTSKFLLKHFIFWPNPKLNRYIKQNWLWMFLTWTQEGHDFCPELLENEGVPGNTDCLCHWRKCWCHQRKIPGTHWSVSYFKNACQLVPSRNGFNGKNHKSDKNCSNGTNDQNEWVL